MDPSYNNSFGSFQQPMVSSGTGDVVLNNSEGKKRGILVFVVALVAVAIVGVLMMLVLGGGSVSSNPRVAFDEFREYMLVGPYEEEEENEEENEINIDDVEEEDAYYIYIWQNGDYDRQSEYFNEAEERLGRLKNSVSGETASLVEGLAESLMNFRLNSEISRTDILERKFIEDRKNGIADYMTEIGVEEDSMLHILANSSERLFTMFYNGGCIEKGSMNNECTTELVDSNPGTMSLLNEVHRLKQNINSNNNNLGEIIFSQINELNGRVGVDA